MFGKLFRKIQMIGDNYMDRHYVTEFKVPEIKSNKNKTKIHIGRNDIRIKQPGGKESRGHHERI